MILLFMVARLRLFVVAVLALANLVHAHESTLFTSSVSYCDPARTLLIQKFDVAYFASNSSVSFNISASSVEPNVNVTANLLLNVYGMHPVNLTLDLCNLLGGALCPLPMYNFTGSDSIPLSSYVDVSGKVPAIGYKVPDLEGYVQLKLIDVNDGKTRACVQATLSNGWSTHQLAVEWATGALALFGLLLSLWLSSSSDSLVPYRLLELIYLYQSISVTAFLGLNYPLTYRSYALNFAWAMGLFSSHSFRKTIDNMRHRTGGHMDSSDGTALALTNRKMSPYNAIAKSGPVTFFTPQSFSVNRAAISNSLSNFFSSSSVAQIRASSDVATVTSTAENSLDPGIPVYVNTINISTPDAFMTIFFVALILLAIVFCVVVVAFAVIKACTHFGLLGEDRARSLKERTPVVVKSWCLRLALVIFTPIVLFAFYQWTLKDSWASSLLAALAFTTVITLVAYSGFLALRWRDFDTWPFHAPLWGQYRSNRLWFFIPLIAASICKAIFVAFAKNHGKLQVILMTIVEFLVLVSILTFRPHLTRGGDVLSSYLAIVRLVCTGLMAAFIVELDLAPIPRVVIGLITAVIFSVAVVVMFFNFVFHLIQCFRTRVPIQRLSSGRESSELEEPSMQEKGKESP